MTGQFVSVVIVSYNSLDDLTECIPSLMAQDYPDYEIIIVDNNSVDNTISFVEGTFPHAKVIKNKENYGAAKGYNIGITASRGKYVVLLNPDTVVEKHWMIELVKVMEADDSIAACQSRVLLYENRDTINTEGNEVNYLGFTWCRNYRKKNTDGGAIQETLGLSVCSAILRRNVLEEAGSFDDDFFMYLDDTDLGLRMQLLGYRVVCNPQSIVYHKYKFLTGKKKLYYLERNRLLLLLKVYNKEMWLRMLPIFIFMEMGIFVISIFQGWFREKIKSYAWIIWRWRLVKVKRKSICRETRQVHRILKMMNPEVTFDEIKNPILDKFVNPLLRVYYRILVRS
jgi:hypothetical protein